MIVIDTYCRTYHDPPYHARPPAPLAAAASGSSWLSPDAAAQLGSLEQCPFFGIFLDLRKAYDAMDRDRCFKGTLFSALESGRPDFWKIKSTLFLVLVLRIRAFLKIRATLKNND